ncbi:MAG TPA: peroxidase family protein [Phycisphaerae bacterium]
MSDIFDLLVDHLTNNVEWFDLPLPLGLAKLMSIRDKMRKDNLVDTEEPPLESKPGTTPPEALGARREDGMWNNETFPKMGAAGCRFGRNFPLTETRPDVPNLLNPNPRTVSSTLMTRDTFKPVAGLNLLAGAWIQFMVHDWFIHKRADPQGPDVIKVPAAADPADVLIVPITPAEPAPAGSTHPPAYANTSTHWWDASSIYGDDAETIARLRTGTDGKLKIEPSGRLLPDPTNGLDLTGFTENWWLGLALLHSLFTLEHNYVCDQLKAAYPDNGDEWIFQKARLVISALLAKIHTVEWTPAIVPHPTAAKALHINWNGLAGDELQDLFPFLNNDEVLGGIVGSHAEQYAAPFSLTEEFVSVYRMHPLLPDDFTFSSAQSGKQIATYELLDLAGRATRAVQESMNPADMLYSFGIMHPGAVTLHNYPKHLQTLKRDDGETLDLAAVDIIRDRERGVPRYNRFRTLVGKKPVTSWEELTDNSTWREQIKAVYGGDLEAVDLMTGLYAEPLPPGFGFSETAFRIFILMASRRLKSDRFFTDSFKPEIYTPVGYGHVRANGLASVLLRHYPILTHALHGVMNPFFPWNLVDGE